MNIDDELVDQFSKSSIHDLHDNFELLQSSFAASEDFFHNFDPNHPHLVHHLKSCLIRYSDYKEHIDLYGYLIQAIDSFIVSYSLCDAKLPHTLLQCVSLTLYIDRLILFILGVHT